MPGFTGMGGFLQSLQFLTTSPIALSHFAVVIFEHLPLTQQLTFSSLAIAKGAATMKAARINSANTFFILDTSFELKLCGEYFGLYLCDLATSDAADTSFLAVCPRAFRQPPL